MTLVRRVAVFCLGAWIGLAVTVLVAPLSLHAGILDALRVPVLWACLFATALAALLRAWWRGVVTLTLGILLLSPWAMSGTSPLAPGNRKISLVLLPSSSAEAFEYALSRRPDLILVPDLSDRMAGFFGGDRKVLWEPQSFDAPLGYLGRVAAEYRPWLVDGLQGTAIFLRTESVTPDKLRLRDIPGLPALVFDARIAGKELTFAVLHLSRPFPIGEFGRQASEVRAIATALAEIPRPMIVAGDFNALPWSAATREIAGAIDAGASHWTGGFPTGAPLLLPIDQILAGRSLTIMRLESGPDVGSVHLPLEAVISLPR